MNDREYARQVARLEMSGRLDGNTAAREYIPDGQTPEEARAAAIRTFEGIRANDPAIMDTLPWLDLSGQWADGLTVDDIVEYVGLTPDDTDPDIVTELVDAYQQAYDQWVVRTIENLCKRILGGGIA